jgi:hypothetical protein
MSLKGATTNRAVVFATVNAHQFPRGIGYVSIASATQDAFQLVALEEGNVAPYLTRLEFFYMMHSALSWL